MNLNHPRRLSRLRLRLAHARQNLYPAKGGALMAYVVGGTRQKLLMISTVTNKGKQLDDYRRKLQPRTVDQISEGAYKTGWMQGISRAG
jgi:hypothetical protein